MDWKLFLTVFATLFLAELGDKTQIATLVFAAEGRHGRWTVFVAASLALVAVAGISVVAGEFVGRHVTARTLRWIAGSLFIALGAWTLLRAGTG